MDGTSQPDFHDLLRMEDDVLDSASRHAESPERDLNDSTNNLIKINTPAKVLMVGDPVMVKTEQMDDSEKFDGNTDSMTNSAETSGSSNEELADGIHTPSPGTAAAMESLIADDDLSSESPKLDEVPRLPAPVNFTNSSTITKVSVKPQTSIMTAIRTHQPISIAGKKIMVTTQPIQIVKKEGGGGPVLTKFIVKKTSTSAAATSKTPVVFTKNKGLLASPSKSGNFQSGSIVLSPIKGGFKIPISPMKSPIKVSVIPPSNVKKVTTVGKPFIVPLQTTATKYLQTSQASLNNNTFTIVNGIGGQGNKKFVDQRQISIPVTSKVISVNSTQPHVNNNSNQTVQQLNVVPNTATIQDSRGMKIQYVQLIPPNSNTLQQPTIRSNQGQPITFTSVSQVNGGNLALNQPGTSLTFLQSKLQHSSNSSNSHRKAQTVKIAIPSQSTPQVKPQQRLIMPATNLHPIRPNLSSLPPGSVLTPGNVPGNIGYAMVPAKYVEQLTKQLNSQSFVQDNLQPSQKSLQGKMGSNGKLKKPCNCTKSQCLKLYCECFANGQFCDECNCINCSNNLEHEMERSKAVKQCLERNPAAFRPKIGRGKDDNRTHQKGCNCKRSGCLKNYCECYEARIPCTSKCKCIGCKNYEETGDRRSLMSLADAAEVRVQQQTAAKTKLSNQIGDSRPTTRTTLSGERLPYTFFTQEVIEATCTCLLAQAEEAEKTNRPMAVAEAMIIEEFGRCVMQIIQSAGKAKAQPLHIH